ncbi:methylesterase 17 [Amborella trichopoda]|uniref:methylesterase 17 n=1 Tax=Amborella trichopoda TaxID=13333 RepID=UPI0005D369E2|nr:methylesterase 17 [Amborella trichopoda]|eukprot:XP_011622735.1 methylesterase 17 [Amborella trichopoda]
MSWEKNPGILHFVLVPGACHGAWCWHKIVSLLRNKGHKVSAVDLAGAGIDPRDADSISSSEEHNKPLIDLISTIPDDENLVTSFWVREVKGPNHGSKPTLGLETSQVVLVAHSAGGLSLGYALHLFGKKISLAVYLTAVVHKGLDSDDKEQFGDHWEFGFGLGPDKPPTSALFRRETQRELLYQLSPDEDSTLASMLLRSWPLGSIYNACYEGEHTKDIDKVPRVYIKTLKDNLLKPELQEEMIKCWPPTEVMTMDTDHSPFFSAPNELLGLLLKASALYCGERIS